MWVMSTIKVEGEYHIYIGAVKVAEIAFTKAATKWKCFMRVGCGVNLHGHYDSMSEALKELHRLLKSPPEEK